MPAGLITGLRGVDLGVPDLVSHVRFYTDVWRLSVVAEREGSVYLRGTGACHHVLALHRGAEPSLLCINLAAADHHSLAFHPGEASTLHHIAFEMDSIDSVMRGAGRMRDAGHPIEWGPGRHAPARRTDAGRAEENRLLGRAVPPIK